VGNLINKKTNANRFREIPRKRETIKRDSSGDAPKLSRLFLFTFSRLFPEAVCVWLSLFNFPRGWQNLHFFVLDFPDFECYSILIFILFKCLFQTSSAVSAIVRN